MAERFHPPRLEVPDSLGWVLGRALGPPQARLTAGAESARAEALSGDLLLTSRIARRTPPELLAAELGKDAAARFEAEARNTTALQMQYRATCHMLAGLAAELAIPVVFLKGMALQLTGVVQAGDRPTADVDLLVPEEACAQVQGALMERGFRHSFAVAMRHPHQLPPLWHPQWLGVEVHRLAAGLQVAPGTTAASADQLLDRGLCERLDAMPGAACVPRLDVLLAHLVVHAVVQHPDSGAYFFRLLADVQDVLAGAAALQELLGRAAAWVSWLVPEDEMLGLVRIVEALGRGDDLGVIAGAEGSAATDLRHFVAVVVHRGYRIRQGVNAVLVGERTDDLSRRRCRLPRLWWPRREVLGPDGRPLPWPVFLRWWMTRPLRMAGGLLQALMGEVSRVRQ
jgi:hypothetical protein